MIPLSSRRRLRKIAMLTVLVIFLLGDKVDPPLIENVQAKSGTCSSCHSSYREVGLSLYSPQPMVAGVDNAVRWTVSAPWRNDWIEPSMEVNVSEGTSSEPIFIPWEGSLRGGTSQSGWLNVTPYQEASEITLSVRLDVVAYYDHASSKRPDRQSESVFLNLPVSVEVQVLATFPSLVTLEDGNNTSSTLYNVGGLAITNLSGTAQRGSVSFGEIIAPTGEASHTPFNGTLEPNWRVVVSYVGPQPSSNGTIVSFTGQLTTGVIVEASMTVIPTPLNAELPGRLISGQIAVLYGWLGLLAIGLLMIQGFSKRALDRSYKSRYSESKKMDLDWGAESPTERRIYWWWLHFALLVTFIAFTAVHIAGFGISHSMPPLTFELWLGIFGMLIITVTGYSGLFPKLSKKYLPWFPFRRGHAILGLIGSLFVVWHSVILM